MVARNINCRTSGTASDGKIKAFTPSPTVVFITTVSTQYNAQPPAVKSSRATRRDIHDVCSITEHNTDNNTTSRYEEMFRWRGYNARRQGQATGIGGHGSARGGRPYALRQAAGRCPRCVEAV